MGFKLHYKLSGFSALIVATAVVVACTPQDNSKTSHESVIDLGSFAPYVAEFQQKGAEFGAPVEITDLVIKFGGMTSALERGYCEMGTGKSPTIVIDESYWNQASEGSRKALLLHELGHCVLERKHISALTNTGVPDSLMSPYTIPANVFTFNEQHYWQELFSVSHQL